MEMAMNNKSRAKFFSLLHQATRNLGLSEREEIDEYRHKVMAEEANCNSMKQLSLKGYEACMRRFALDAGNYLEAGTYSISAIKRKAYIVKVMAMQIMQLKGGSEHEARSYIAGILSQARIACGKTIEDGSFWMDINPKALLFLIPILDTYRRRLLKQRFPEMKQAFDPSLRFEVGRDSSSVTYGVAAEYRQDQSFKVHVIQ